MKTPMIGGFHSPLVRSVLEVMLAAHAPVVIVIVRKLDTARLPAAWQNAAQAGTAAVVSMKDATNRLTAELSMQRNHSIAASAANIVVAEVATGGGLAECLVRWRDDGFAVRVLSDV